MNKKPVFLNLLQIKFPISAIVSILHRISGVILFFAIPFLLYLLQKSLHSEESCQTIIQIVGHSCWKITIWVSLSLLFLHLLAGLRHLLMDFGFAETKCGGKITAMIVLGISAFVVLGLGYCIW